MNNTKSGAGEELLLLFCRAEARAKGVFVTDTGITIEGMPQAKRIGPKIPSGRDRSNEKVTTALGHAHKSRDGCEGDEVRPLRKHVL